MKAHYLMIKAHNITGLKYLCKKTTDNINKCYRYTGSGTYWKRHLSKHGNDITTTVIEVHQNLEEFSKKALYWSEYYDIVESSDWANLIKENGSNRNDRSFEQMIINRSKSIKKLQDTKEYQLTRKRCGKQTSLRQKGVTMKQKMGDKYVDPRRGKKMKDIYKNGHLHPQAKPYRVILNNGEREWVFLSEGDIRQIGLYPSPSLYDMKLNGFIVIKKNS